MWAQAEVRDNVAQTSSHRQELQTKGKRMYDACAMQCMIQRQCVGYHIVCHEVIVYVTHNAASNFLETEGLT